MDLRPNQGWVRMNQEDMMSFCWMDEAAESSQPQSGTKRSEAAAADVRERSALMRRLGRSKADAVHRCLGNVAWAYSVSGTPALTPAQIRKIVNSVYAGA